MKGLSEREYEIAEQVSRGLSESEIADKLFISPTTVHNHTYRIRKKWKAKSAVDICRMFILKLDDPKRFFAAMIFLIIQISITFDYNELDMRRPPQTRTRTSIRAKKGKRKEDE